MCSNKWAKPVRSGFSFLEPTLYVTAIEYVGALWSSERITRKPFFNLYSLKLTVCAQAAEDSNIRAQSACIKYRFIIIRKPFSSIRYNGQDFLASRWPADALGGHGQAGPIENAGPEISSSISFVQAKSTDRKSTRLNSSHIPL